jgi:hypothetical protein
MGTPAVPAIFVPDSAAYAITPSGSHTLSIAQTLGLVNTIFGSATTGSAFTLSTTPTTQSLYSAHAYHALFNQPLILHDSNQCIRDNLYFNDTRFMTPTMRAGKVVFGD